jgi:hypothetical protein
MLRYAKPETKASVKLFVFQIGVFMEFLRRRELAQSQFTFVIIFFPTQYGTQVSEVLSYINVCIGCKCALLSSETNSSSSCLQCPEFRVCQFSH